MRRAREFGAPEDRLGAICVEIGRFWDISGDEWKAVMSWGKRSHNEPSSFAAGKHDLSFVIIEVVGYGSPIQGGEDRPIYLLGEGELREQEAPGMGSFEVPEVFLFIEVDFVENWRMQPLEDIPAGHHPKPHEQQQAHPSDHGCAEFIILEEKGWQ